MSQPVPFAKNPHSWFIIAAVMLSTVMEILDTTIVNVSLPHMMGSLGADRDEISWVLTSYIVAAGMLMPLTGFLVNRIGCKRLLLINIIGFMLASALCGISANLAQIVFFRLLQGVFGSSLVPLSQYILREKFPMEDQPKVMAIWGIGVMAAPVMGPTLGGYITDALNWRWVFFINVPVCLVNFFLVLTFIKETARRQDIIDWTGLILMVVSIGCLQLFLDRGEVDDWFASSTICTFFVVFVVTFILFIFHCLRIEHPIINLRLFKNRNFAFGTIIMTFFAASVLGSLALLPQMLETLFGYTSNLSGLAMAPRGIASGVVMGIASRLIMMRVDPRWLVFFGLSVAALSAWWLSEITMQASFGYIITIGFIQGLGIGFFFMPLTTIVYSTLSRNQMAEAAGLFNFGRNIGNAMGISILTTFLDHEAQTNWHNLAAHIHPSNANLLRWLSVHSFSIHDKHVIGMIGSQINKQANFIAYMHTFRLCSILLYMAVLMVLLLKASENKGAVPADAH